MDESLKARRAQYFIDGELQGTLLRRVVAYWLLALASFALGQLVVKLLWGASLDRAFLLDALQMFLPALVIALLPLPLILSDLLRVTHRFAGPMLRIRRGLSELAQGGDPPPIAARAGDAWPQCVEDFNEVARRLSPDDSSPTDR